MNKQDAIETFVKNAKETKRVLFFRTVQESLLGNNYISTNGYLFYEDIRSYLDSELSDIEHISFIENKNKLENIPDEIFKLNKLKELDISEQQINSIPDDIFKLDNLQYLSINNNKFTCFPEILLKLKNIKELGLLGNPFGVLNFGYERINFGYKEDSPDKERSYNTFLKESITPFETKYKENHKDTEINIYEWGLQIIETDYNIYLYRDRKLFDISWWGNNLFISIEQKNNKEINRKEIFIEFNTIIKNIVNSTDLLVIPSDKSVCLFPHTNFSYEPIFYEVVTSYYKTGITKYRETEYFIDDLIKYAGGTELLKDIEDESIKEKRQAADGFLKQNKNITELQIQDFKIIRNLRINELSSKVNIVIGINGTGKTTMLQTIAIGLLPTYNDELPWNLYKSFLSKGESQKKQFTPYSQIKLKWNNFEREQRVYEFNIQSNKELPSIYFFAAYGANVFCNIDYDHSEIIKNLISGDSKSFSTYSIFSDKPDKFFDPLKILNLLHENSKNATGKHKSDIENLRDTFLDNLNKFLSDNDIEAFKIENKLPFHDLYYFNDNRGKWILSELSEGYRMNILLVSDILLRILASRKNVFIELSPVNEIFKEVRGTIMIDEFDKHLHPRWQRSFLPALTSILPNIQFILTTHNPIALQSGVGGKVIKLDYDDKDGIKADMKELRPKSVIGIIREYFTSDFFPSKIQNQLNKLYDTLEGIYDGSEDINIVHSDSFKNQVKDLSEQSPEIYSMIAGELAQLNENLRRLNLKEFVL